MTKELSKAECGTWMSANTLEDTIQIQLQWRDTGTKVLEHFYYHFIIIFINIINIFIIITQEYEGRTD